MISLSQGESKTKLCDVYIDGRRQGVWFHQRIDQKYRNVIESVRPILEDHDFREKFDLSRKNIEDLIPAIEKEDIPEDTKLRKKYFRVKSAVDALSLSEMSLEGDDRFEVNLPAKKNEFSGSLQITSPSGGGKTYWVVQLLLRNWALSKNQRRHVVYISNEATVDKSLKALKKARYEKLITIVDVSDSAIDAFVEGGKPKDKFFLENVKPDITRMPNDSILVLDDHLDSEVFRELHAVLNKMLRVGRHEGKSTITINHLINSGYFARQLASSVRWRVMFPRSSKMKITRWIHERTDLPMSAARAVVQKIAVNSRWLAVHMHSPVALVSAQYIKLI